MKHYTLPKALYHYPGVKKILYHNDSCLLFKKLTTSILSQEKMCTSHSFVFVVNGRVEVENNQGELVIAGKHELLFMPRDTYLVSDYIAEDQNVEVYLVFLEHHIIARFLSAKIHLHREKLTAGSGLAKLKTNDKIVHYFDSLNTIYSDMEHNKEVLELKLLEFLHLAYLINEQEIVNTLYSSENENRKRNIESIMLDNFDKNLTVADFANLSGRSLSTFNRDFIKKYNQTPKQWLITKKMEKSDQLLLQGITVTQCAVEVGYSNVSHFIKAYKSVTGKTPNTMKKVTL